MFRYLSLTVIYYTILLYYITNLDRVYEANRKTTEAVERYSETNYMKNRE